MTTEEQKTYYREYRRIEREKKAEHFKKYRQENANKFKVYSAKYLASERGKAAREKLRQKRLEKLYGVTQEIYERLLKEQDGACAICRRPATEFKRRLAVDHDHQTNEVRGLLCFTCNTFIGAANDDTDLLGRAIFYLERGNSNAD